MKRQTWKVVLAVIVGYLFVGRGIGELFMIDYHDPSSYQNDWGGPSLAGVLAVHCGPAVLVLGATFVWLIRRQRPHSKGNTS
jgi:hypothetical protein